LALLKLIIVVTSLRSVLVAYKEGCMCENSVICHFLLADINFTKSAFLIDHFLLSDVMQK